MRIYSLILSMLLLVACQEKDQKKPELSMEEEALRIHNKVMTVDTHVDINVRNFTDSVNYTQRLNTQVNLPKMEEGGLDVAWFIVYTGQDTLTDSGYAKAEANALGKFEAIHRLCEEIAPDRIGLATTSAEAREIYNSGKKVAMIGVENAYPMGTDLANFEKYHSLGARYVSLAHNGHSQFSDSNTGETDDIWLHNGLSDLGKEAVVEMNRLGIMIDISHPSKEANMQMLALSKAPIIASHSSARALCDHSRNLDDDQLLRLKENGGVVQTVALAGYVNKEKSAARDAFMKDIMEEVADSLGVTWYERSEFRNLSEAEQEAFIAVIPQVTSIADEIAANRPDTPPAVDVSDFVDHIDYMVELIGIDHVGISSDFDGGGGIQGWSDASETFNVTLELVSRGYSEEDIAKLWGGNLLRVLDEVQAVAENWPAD
ncbi:dipeptidase [Robiginitalea aurantiaca]|uniref:Dipeptidase n=1 Tax=Robiginitalea aurantiaca TaxID=3056915 RepID=A0ABT7WFS7_9FLAO|nr:dipeptidase [Robiginitalea aurantiaca]MDM9631770.1 dipeptidase [Robiginitalea aurantiaca]